MDSANSTAHHPQQYHRHVHELLVKIFCKLENTFHLSVRNEKPVMAPSNSNDPTQLWIKDESYGQHIRENFGFPAFILIHNATKKVLRHAKCKGHESQDFGEGFKSVRMASNTLLNVTLFHEAEEKPLFHVYHGKSTSKEIKEGTPLVLDTWHENDNQF